MLTSDSRRTEESRDVTSHTEEETWSEAHPGPKGRRRVISEKSWVSSSRTDFKTPDDSVF